MRLHNTYDDIISVENLLTAWREFLRGKRKRKDVERFSMCLGSNILDLHYALVNRTYYHGAYTAFKINDPKPRDIHKASVADRLLHHAIYRVMYSFFDNKFIHDSYSCRLHKGTHKAINQFRRYSRIVSKNYRKTAWVLKCDIRKFFANIDHKILLKIIERHVSDKDTINLLDEIISSFETKDKPGVGLPLGNLTSQLLVNIYMNVFDHFVKRKLKAQYYIRYADDFVILHKDKSHLENILPKISEFLETRLKLSLHPDKVFIKTVASGIDFLGWLHFPHHRVPRTSTKKRMFKNLKIKNKSSSVASYIGLMSHGNTHRLKEKIKNNLI